MSPKSLTFERRVNLLVHEPMEITGQDTSPLWIQHTLRRPSLPHEVAKLEDYVRPGAHFSRSPLGRKRILIHHVGDFMGVRRIIA